VAWLIVALLAFGLAVGVFAAQETAYSASTTSTSPAVTFGPGTGRTVVESVSASCDVALGAIRIYARGGAGRVNCAATNAISGTTNIVVVNTDYGLTNDDMVVYVHATGTAEQRTISVATTTNVTLTAAISSATASGDAIYEVTLQGKIVVAAQDAGVGTNTLYNQSGSVFASPGESPLYITLDSATNTCLQATVGK